MSRDSLNLQQLEASLYCAIMPCAKSLVSPPMHSKGWRPPALIPFAITAGLPRWSTDTTHAVAQRVLVRLRTWPLPRYLHEIGFFPRQDRLNSRKIGMTCRGDADIAAHAFSLPILELGE
jgi:hypothetical protein